MNAPDRSRARPTSAWIGRWLLGRPGPAPSWRSSRALFTRGTGVVAALAFLSLWVQVEGLIGSHGITPVAEAFASIRKSWGITPWTEAPSLLWIDASDTALDVLCGGGVLLSVLLVLDVAPALCLLGIAASYLSLLHAGDVFLQLQWDSLLVETSLVGVFYAPWRLWRGRGRDPEPSRLARWLVWWLVFRLLFESGVVKLTWGDEAWRDLSALSYHYVTQPLPHGASWHAHQLPRWLHEASALGMFAAELILPFGILGPRRVRHLAGWGMAALQASIAATGNYGFFNLLSVLLCLSLLDDAALAALCFWRRDRRAFPPPADPPAVVVRWTRHLLTPAFAVLPITLGILHLSQLHPERRRPPIREEEREAGPIDTLREGGPARAAEWLESHARPFLAVNPYGLFRVMTRTRPEIRAQGLPAGADPDDREAWIDYDFRFKPDSDLAERPRLVQPHMPRLDWRLWFEALRWDDWRRQHGGRMPYAQAASGWFQRFLVRLWEAEPAVLELLRSDPFDGARPGAVRAQLWDYRFTTPGERPQRGAYWAATPLDARGLVLER